MAKHIRVGSMDDLPPERRSTTVAALRRGDIKISEPVPLENSGPSPIWKTSHPPTDSVMGFNTSDGSQFQGDMSSSVPEDGPSHNSVIAEDAPPLRHKRSSGFMRDKESLQDQSSAPSSHPRSSTIDSQDMGTPNSKKKRRSGSLRTAFRRMFSKREKTAPIRTSPPAKQSRHEYHKSDTAAMPGTTLGSLREDKEEAFRSRGRQSHSRNDSAENYHPSTPIAAPRLPFPMNINAPQTSPSYHNYTSFESSPQVHRRRATLPSVILSPTEAAALNKYWKNDATGPTEDRDLTRTPTPLIGLAITSGSNPNRRSRSADALREMAQRQAPKLRRRSAEIQYWRAKNHGIPEAEEAEAVPSSQSASIKDFANESDHTSEHSHAVIENASPHDQEAKAPSLHSANDQPAVQVDRGETVSRIDLRLSQLEFNMEQLGRSLHNLSGHSHPPQPSFVLEKPPTPKASRHPGLPSNPRDTLPIPSSSMSHHRSTSSLKQSTPSINRSQDDLPRDGTPPVLSSSTTAVFSPPQEQHYADQPSPFQQIHNFSTPLSASVSSAKTPDQLVPLYNALRYERSVRKQLENQVLQLQRDLLQLTTVVATMRGINAYPFTPSPDHGAREADEGMREEWKTTREGPSGGSGWRGDMF